MEREHPTFNVYKGLQKPLIFKGLKGKFIYIGAGCAIGALLSSVIISNIISYTWGGITLCIVMFGGLTLMNGLFHFDGSEPVPLIELICLASLIGIIMIVIMYSFIMFVLRIIGKYNSKNSRVYIEVIKTACKILAIVAFAAFILWCLNTYVLFL